MNKCRVCKRETIYEICNFCAVAAGQGVEQGDQADDRHAFSSGAMSSGKKPRYDLLPMNALARTARRFEEGAIKYGVNNWRTGIEDMEFLIDRTNHAIEHLKKIQERIHAGLFFKSEVADDDASAVAWAALVLMEAEDAATRR